MKGNLVVDAVSMSVETVEQSYHASDWFFKPKRGIRMRFIQDALGLNPNSDDDAELESA